MRLANLSKKEALKKTKRFAANLVFSNWLFLSSIDEKSAKINDVLKRLESVGDEADGQDSTPNFKRKEFDFNRESQRVELSNCKFTKQQIISICF